MKREKIWHIFGVILGVATILIGVYFACTPAWSGISTTITKDDNTFGISGYSGVPDDTSFGGDYYTYEYGATRSAAITAHLMKKTIDNMCEKMALYVGSAFILVGLLLILNESRKLFCNPKNANKAIEVDNQMISSSSVAGPDGPHNEVNTVNSEITSVANVYQTPMNNAPVIQTAKNDSFNFQAIAGSAQFPEQRTKMDHLD